MIGKSLHSLMYIFGAAAMIIVSLCVRKRLELKIWNSLLFTVVAFLSDGLGAFLMGKAYTAVVASLGGDGVSNYSIYGAVFLTPVLIMLSARVINQPWRQIIDMVALSEMFARAFGKLGCVFFGCCWGFECDYGVYNYLQKKTMFPSPIFEVGTMLIIIVIGFLFLYKSKRYVPGCLYPIMSLLYGVTRFFWEFTRYYTSEAERYLILGMSLWQVCSIITVVLSALWLVGIKKDWLGKAMAKVNAYAQAKRLEKEEAERKARAEKRKNKKRKKK